MVNPLNVKIAVLMGGVSSERDVSLRSGKRVAEALRSLGCFVKEVDVKDDNISLPDGTEIAFLALHGTGGEDGQIQLLLEKYGIPFTGSGSKASRLAFDKVEAKNLFRQYHLLTPQDVVIDRHRWREGLPSIPFGYPMVVKPSAQGSSIGVRIIQQQQEILPAIEEAFKSDDVVLVEEFIEGRELTVGILADKPLPVVEIRPKSGWYDYHNKYTEGATEELVPAPIDEHLREKVQEEALRAHRILGCRDLSRADFRLDAEGKTYILEVNTLPGMTSTSLLPTAAAAAGITFPKLCLALVERALNCGKKSR